MWSELPENCMTELTELKLNLKQLKTETPAPLSQSTGELRELRELRDEIGGAGLARLPRRLDNRRPIADTPASAGGI